MKMFKSFNENEDRRKRTLTTAQLKDFKAAVGKCEICGEKLPISVRQHHHIRPKEKGGSDNLLTNVIVVCGTCHNKAHSGFYTQKQREFLKKRSKKVIEQIKAIERRRQNLSKKGKSKGSDLLPRSVRGFHRKPREVGECGLSQGQTAPLRAGSRSP